MKFTVKTEPLGHNMVRMNITVPAAELTRALDNAYLANKDNYSLLTSRKAVEDTYGADTFMKEAMNELLSAAYVGAVESEGLDIASDPSANVEPPVEGKDVIITIEVAVRPAVKLGQYKGIEVPMPSIVVTEEELSQAIAQAQAQNATYADVDRPAQLGDTAVIDFTGYKDGVPFDGGAGTAYPLVLGSGSFIPGFEEQLVGAAAGSEVDVNVTFPEQYGAADLAGQPALFKVTVRKVQERTSAPLTEEQQEQIKSTILEQKKAMADQEVEDAVLSKLLETSEMDIPEAMIVTEAHIVMEQFTSELASKGADLDAFCRQTGKTPQEILEEMKPISLRRIQLRLLIGAIADAENITVSQEELDQQWELLSQQYGLPTMQLKAYFGENADKQISADLRNQKAYALLRESTILVNPNN